MANVDEFLKQNPSLAVGASLSDSDLGGVRLDGTIIGISEQHVKFSHMGTDYLVAKEQVLDITERDDPTVPGKAVTLTLTRDATMLANYSVTAADLASALPFSLARPAAVPTRRYAPSAREIAWRQATRYVSEYPSLEIYLSAFQTVTVCDSYSAGILDDSLADDERADY